MSLVEDIELMDVDLDLQPDLHWPCCRHADKFICKHPYHPEADIVMVGDEDPEKCCAQCRKMQEKMRCSGGSNGIPHFHCPIEPRLCPFTEDGRLVRENANNPHRPASS